MAVFEKPPILRGTEQDQLNAIRDYLFRMAQSLSEAAAAPAVAVTETVRPDGSRVYESGGSAGRSIDDIRNSANELRSLIIKTANDVKAYTNKRIEKFSGYYVAQSDFGQYIQDYSNEIITTALGDVNILKMVEDIEGLNHYVTEINGEIRRGFVEDPDHPGQYVIGIAVSQNLVFNAEETRQDGEGRTYYKLESGQTFGLYTSTGWQFWIDGHKRGWFDSSDGMLHVAQIVVEQSLQIGDSWLITAATDGSEFEIKFIGS